MLSADEFRCTMDVMELDSKQLKKHFDAVYSEVVDRVKCVVSSDDEILGSDCIFPSYPTYAVGPTPKAINEVYSKGGYSFVVNAGGTHWNAVKIMILRDGVHIGDHTFDKSFSTSESRKYESLEEFVVQIADLLFGLINRRDVTIRSLAVVLGFPQINKKTEYGIDAFFVQNQQSKGWYIGGEVKGKPIGKTLIEVMKDKYNIEIQNVVFGNDAAFMQWDVNVSKSEGEKIAPVGGVFGSGTNIGVVPANEFTEKEDYQDIINLEAGQISNDSCFSDEDKNIYKKVKELDLEVPDKKVIEFYVGGDYLRYNFAAKTLLELERNDMELTDKLKERMKECLEGRGRGEIVSKARKASRPGILAEVLEIDDVNELLPYVEVIQDSAAYVLDNAGMKIGLVVASCVKVAGLDKDTKWVIPCEGSVAEKGEGILPMVNKVMNELQPEMNVRLAVNGSSKKAMAIYSMYNSIQQE